MFQTKLPNDTPEVDILDRPKTPQAPEPPLPREPILPPTIPFPFFPAFPAAPGLIPHPIFSRFPMGHMGRGGPGPHPAMPNVAMPPRFLNPPTIKADEFTLSKMKPVEREKQQPLMPSSMELTTSSIPMESERVEKEKVDNKLAKAFKPTKELSFMKVPERIPPAGVAPPIMSAPVAPITLATPTISAVQISPPKNSKAEKTEKNDMVNSVGDHISLDTLRLNSIY